MSPADAGLFDTDLVLSSMYYHLESMILKSHFRTQADSLAKGQSQDISNVHVSYLSRTPNMISLVTVYCHM